MAQIFKAKKKSVSQKMLTLTVSAMDHQGRGVAKQGSKVCFVNGALPGEEVKAQLIDDKARFASADCKKVLRASAHRVTPFCQHYQVCGGCQLQHLDASQQLVEKQAAVSQLFSKFAKAENLKWQAPLVSEARHYRRSARVAVMHDKAAKKMRVGYRAQGSKQLVSIERCDVLSTKFSALFTVFDDLINNHAGLSCISHLQLCEADNAAYVVIRHTKPISNALKTVVEKACDEYQWCLVWQSHSGEIDHTHHPMPYYTIPEYDLTFEFGLENFVQVNQHVNQAMLHQAKEWLDLQGHEQVLDLFCGIGNFSLLIAKYAKHVIGVEGVDSAVALAKQNAQTNSLLNTDFYCFDLTQSMQSAAWFSKDIDVLVLDPSRTGAMAILEQLPLTQFKTILYVSCDPVTLARDSAIILQAGFSIEKIGLMNMFPHTGHIETMALFHRR